MDQRPGPKRRPNHHALPHHRRPRLHRANLARRLGQHPPRRLVRNRWPASTGAIAGSVQVSGITAPAWVKLVRTGNSFTAFYATTAGTPTAADWIALGSAQIIAMNSTAQVGLAATSHLNGTLSTSTFS